MYVDDDALTDDVLNDTALRLTFCCRLPADEAQMFIRAADEAGYSPEGLLRVAVEAYLTNKGWR